ncbi:MAG: type IV secretion system protein [Methylococcaceae bacterium]
MRLKKALIPLLLTVPTQANAFAVLDIANLIQAIFSVIQEYEITSETATTAIQTAQTVEEVLNTIKQLEREYDSLTGPRGFEKLLNSTVERELRRHLPGTYADIIIAIKNDNINAAMRGFKKAVDEYNEFNQPYEPEVIYDDPATESARQYQEYYDSNRAYHGIATASLDGTSTHFDDADTFVENISKTNDMKGATDLGNRINAENTRLLTEQIRIQASTLKSMNDRDQDEMRRRANDHKFVNEEAGGMFNSKTADAFLLSRGIKK